MRKTLHSRHNEILLEMLRLSRGNVRLRQADLAHRIGSGQGTVSKAERGERRLDVLELRDWLLAMDIDFVVFVRELDRRLRCFPTTDGRLSGNGTKPRIR